MKKIVAKNGKLQSWSMVVALVLIMFWHTSAMGGEGSASLDHSSAAKIEVQLVGADRFELVQLVDHLLAKIPGVIVKEQTGLHLQPEAPDRSTASWVLGLRSGDEEDVLRELHEMIRELSREGHKQLLIDYPHHFEEQDLELLSEIVPVGSLPGFARLAVRGRANEYTVQSGEAEAKEKSAWYAMPGAGFE